MDPKTPLWKAHDISEHLQSKIEALPQIERAFVHVDYETSHQPVRSPAFLGISESILTVDML